MIDKTVKKIEETVAGAPSLSEEKREQLLALLGELKTEITRLSRTHRETALSIADKSHASARHATREDRDEQAVAASIDDLTAVVKKFEASHPGLVSVVNSFCNALADLGI
ncbi:MAG: DUF4404 domain-containing protein [PVC group bacterium]